MNLPKARTENIIVQNLNGETLIYDLITDQAFCLNETSAFIYQACGDGLTFDELKRKNKFTDDLIHLALEDLRKENLIEGTLTGHFGDLSRREIIRRVGLASMAALPVIASLVAPTAVMAQSCGSTTAKPLGCSCTGSGQCASGCCALSGICRPTINCAA